MPRAVRTQVLAESSALVSSLLGLHFPQTRWSDLERGLAGAARELGLPDADAVASRLRARRLSRAETEILASHLTIGETYFFRDPEAFRLLEEAILPEVLRAGDREKSLRVWSAACSTGEEPYSIAMLLDRVLPPDWNASILATDVNPGFLRKAARGIYGAWSFRAMPPGARERYFHETGRRRWELDERIRKRVTFSCLNLVADPFPSFVSETNAMDVIFCRNVLMYFAPERAQDVARKLDAALVPGGWLVVSPVETSATVFADFESAQIDGRTFYRKRRASSNDTSVSPLGTRSNDTEVPFRAGARDPGAWKQRISRTRAPGSLAPLGMTTPHLPQARRRPAPARHHMAEDPRPAKALSAAELIAEAKRSAGEGRLADARVSCERAVAVERANPAYHHLLAVIQQEMGDGAGARASLGRALYLDPAFVPAHVALAHLDLREGRRAEAARDLANALEALRKHAPEQILAEADGLTAGRMREIVESLRATLPQSRAERAR